jgi:integrase
MDTIHYLSIWEWESLLKQASGRDRLILLLLYDSGMRVGELVTTRVDDIDFEHGFIRIQSSRCKTRSFRASRISHTP